MSTDCENLLKRFLVLNPSKRGTLEVSQDTRPHRPLHFYHTTPYLSLSHTHTQLYPPSQTFFMKCMNKGTVVSKYIEEELHVFQYQLLLLCVSVCVCVCVWSCVWLCCVWCCVCGCWCVCVCMSVCVCAPTYNNYKAVCVCVCVCVCV